MHHTTNLRSAGVALALAGATIGVAAATPASAAQETQPAAYQAQQVDAYGRLIVEAAYVHAVACNGPGENGRQFYIYQYVNRAGFRVIAPPDYGHAVGGRDWGTFQEAVSVACAGGRVGPPGRPTPPGSPAPTGGVSAQELQQVYQPQQVDGYGRLTVEAAYVHVIACQGGPQNGRQFYIYQYANRRGFRAIAPPDWGHAIGGRDWGSYQEALGAACYGGGYAGPAQPPYQPPAQPPRPPQQPPPPATSPVEWQLTSDCKWASPTWSASMNLSEAVDATLSGTLATDNISPANPGKILPNAKGDWNNPSDMQSRMTNGTMTLVINPNGWVSTLQLTGTSSDGYVWTGSVHHYGGDDCHFTLSRPR